MAWTVVEFKKLYYTVNGGTEKEWNGRFDIPRAPGTQTQLNSIGGTNNNWLYSASRGSHLAEFDLLAALNGGSGENFWDAVHNMPNNGIILVYRESGNDNIAFAIKKTLAGMVFGTKTGSTYAWVAGTNWGVFAVDSTGNTHLNLISTTSINYAIITDGTKYSFCEVDVAGDQQSDWDYDTNYFKLNCGALGDNVSNVLAYLLFGNIPITSGDPYADTGESAEDQVQTGPAQGSHDDTSDTISIPGAPALNLSLNHFISAYVPDITALNGLADFIWGNYDRTDSSKKLSKLFADPSDAIISLHMLPFEPSTSTSIEVTIGRYGTSINMPPLTAQFKDITCGSITIDPYWANYLDHNPFTRYTLFLPYVGEVQLDPDEITGETISVDYRVDCLTGAFVCFVSTATKILAQYQGNCSLQAPTSSADYSRLNSAILTAATAAVGGAVGIGAAAAGAGSVGAGIAAGAGEAARNIPSFAGNAMNVQQAKVNHSHSGALGGASGFMGSQKPYLLIHRARQSVPADANTFKGYPCNAKFNLSDLEGSGFTVVRNIKLDGLKLSEGELEELRGILGSGIYL